MILRKGRFILVASFVAFAAIFFGLGTLLHGAQPVSRPRPQQPRGAAQRSGDDGGFSMTLTEPSDAYLVGVTRIVIEPTLPPGDSVAGMDFFVDGRLVSTDRKAPYATEIDFGADIKRHTIVVTALTAGGRRAKVSFISRAADLAGDSVAPLAIVPAVVRDAGGRFVEGLSVGDFILTENGARQPILHLDNEPVPQSIAVAIQSSAPEDARGALLRGALSFTDALLTFDSLGLLKLGALDAGEVASAAATRADRKSEKPDKKLQDAPSAAAVPAGPTLGFSYDREAFEKRLADLGEGIDRASATPAEALQEATRGLLGRSRGRVILALVYGGPPLIGPPAPGEPPVDEALVEALDAVKKSGSTMNVVVLGAADKSPLPRLRKLTEETGGEFLVVATADEVETACRRISESLRHQYLVSYAPTTPEREGWRTVALAARAPDLVVQTRKTCFASPAPKRP
ncbi:MAG: hypothetical protein DMF51_16040 [Acidobacteria bacterium]|nr:MAG: hypothetical protein DMF51_16040 [Acidobacteriota bacterium]